MRPRFNQNLEAPNNIELNAYGQDNYNAHPKNNKTIGGARGSDAPPEGSMRGGYPSVPDMAENEFQAVNDSYNGSLITAKGRGTGKKESNYDRESYLGKQKRQEKLWELMGEYLGHDKTSIQK